ncbi:ATP-grasp fold amidoligase family protein [Ruminococcus albus]|uniref:TupA-like ATPgrasp n=1 Tax=Ruminococcus albus TaxID=1264 RepID=A0A1I1QPD4_RUMAL|nr:ATP-grasp fold amidoligase family protein [Ruminococcus albus]SFD23909.1 TupA-like ATPgrasp [Ruminococcus albus]
MSRNLFFKKLARFVRRLSCLFLSDRKFLERKYKKKKGELPDLDNPKNFSEKLLYLMLHYRNPLESLCADKLYVNEYLNALGYGHTMKKILAVYNNADEIDFDALPEEFFIKVNHVSGNNMIVNKKTNPDYNKIRSFFSEVLKINYYYVDREPQYRSIRPVIICEECLRDKTGCLPTDYKFYCFNGEPLYYMVSYGEFEHKVQNHKFDMSGKSIDFHFKKKETIDAASVILPNNFDEMVEMVNKLCKPFPHVRVDLYNIDGRIIFGELTFYSNGGIVDIFDKDYDKEIGSWIDLNKYKRDMI